MALILFVILISILLQESLSTQFIITLSTESIVNDDAKHHDSAIHSMTIDSNVLIISPIANMSTLPHE